MVWDWFSGRKPKPADTFLCAYCSVLRRPEEVLFRCRDIHCRKPSQELNGLLGRLGKEEAERVLARLGVDDFGEARTVFKPRSFSHQVPCPVCEKQSHLKVCSGCGNPLPAVPNQPNTLTIVGLRGSGKTCYTLSLIHTIKAQLSRMDSYRMTHSFEDDAGRDYFSDLVRALERTGELPDPTSQKWNQFVQTPSIQMTVRFPRWRNRKRDPRDLAASPLIFHDPAGEWFKSKLNVQQVNFFKHTRSLMVLLDPLTFPGFTPLTPQPRTVSDMGDGWAGDPKLALETMAEELRDRMQVPQDRRIPKDLAVVITKSDCGVFGEDSVLDTLPMQPAPYDPDLTDQVSELCRARLDELGMSETVNAAELNFEHVRFFAVSALGVSPRADKDGKVRSVDPKRWKPRRVEDPFVWILHRWGLL